MGGLEDAVEMHYRGLSVPEIARELEIGEFAVKTAITSHWADEKNAYKARMMEELDD